MTPNTREGIEENRKEYGLLFGAVLNYDQTLMESIWDWHHQQLQKARAEERDRAVEIIKDELRTAPLEVQMTKGIVFANIIGRIHSELDQDKV